MRATLVLNGLNKDTIEHITMIEKINMVILMI